MGCLAEMLSLRGGPLSIRKFCFTSKVLNFIEIMLLFLSCFSSLEADFVPGRYDVHFDFPTLFRSSVQVEGMNVT